jgi:hypothetical protein
VAELALNDVERHAFTGEFDGVGEIVTALACVR